MAQQYSTGVVAIYVSTAGTAAAQTPELLGTAESYPRMEVQTEHGTVQTDLTGPGVPLDRSFAGQRATTGITLTWWSEIVFRKLEKMPSPFSSQAAGQYLVADVGAMLLIENLCFTVWLRYLFTTGAVKPAYAALPQGYRFPYSHLLGGWSAETGSKPMKRSLTFGHVASIDRSAPSLNPVIKLYDNVMTAVVSIPFSFGG